MGRITKETWILAVIVLVGAVLRLINLGAEPYWHDEILSLDIATHFESVRTMLRYIGEVEFHPPLYYVLLSLWTGLWGTGEIAVRSLSVIFGLAVIVLTYLAGVRMLGSRKAGLAAALVTALLPMQVEYSQEARPYIFFCLCGLLCALAVWERSGRRGRYWLAAYVLSAVAGLYLHYSFLFVFAPLAAWWLLDSLFWEPAEGRSRRLITWIGAQAAVAVGFFFWVDSLLYKVFLGQYVIMGMPRTIPALRTPEFFDVLIHDVIWMSKLGVMTKIEALAPLIAKVLLVLVVVAVLRKVDVRSKTHGRPLLFIGWMFLVPIVLFFLSPQAVPYSTIFYRHVIFATVPFALLLGYLFANLRTRHALAFMAVFVATLIPVTSAVVDNDFKWDQDHRVEEAAQFINEYYRTGDIVILPASTTRSNLSHYLRPEIPAMSIMPYPYFDVDIWNSRHTLGLIENEAQVRLSLQAMGLQTIDIESADRGAAPGTSRTQAREKLERLVRLHRPPRIWIYGLNQDAQTIHGWFLENGWRRAFRNVADIIRVDLYELEPETVAAAPPEGEPSGR